jgi:hypothetical protein
MFFSASTISAGVIFIRCSRISCGVFSFLTVGFVTNDVGGRDDDEVEPPAAVAESRLVKTVVLLRREDVDARGGGGGDLE